MTLLAWAIGVLVTAVADLEATRWCLHLGGQEGNPLMAWILHQWGWPGAYAIKMAANGAIIAVGGYARRVRNPRWSWPLAAAVTLQAVAAMLNAAQARWLLS